MKFSDAKKLRKEDMVMIIDKDGRNPIYRKEQICDIEIEDKNVFVRCMDGHLYHHTALKAVSND